MDWETVSTWLGPLLKCLGVLVIGHYIAVYVLKLVNRGFKKGNLDVSLTKFISKTLNIVMHVLIILSALSTIGISTSGILAAFSAVALAVAVALKDSLSNVAGGILLLISPRFATGDFIETESESGTVLSVDLLHTTVLTPDHKQVSIPNGLLINSHITNYSVEPQRRVDITFPIAYEADVEKAKRVILAVIEKHPLVLSEPAAPLVRVSGYGDSAVMMLTRSWCNTADYWTVHFDLTEQVRKALGENDIQIPFNQLDVRILEHK